MGFLPGDWERCMNMNKGQGKPCTRPNQHITHKKVMGVWYGKIKKKQQQPKGRRKNG